MLRPSVAVCIASSSWPWRSRRDALPTAPAASSDARKLLRRLNMSCLTNSVYQTNVGAEPTPKAVGSSNWLCRSVAACVFVQKLVSSSSPPDLTGMVSHLDPPDVLWARAISDLFRVRIVSSRIPWFREKTDVGSAPVPKDVRSLACVVQCVEDIFGHEKERWSIHCRFVANLD